MHKVIPILLAVALQNTSIASYGQGSLDQVTHPSLIYSGKGYNDRSKQASELLLAAVERSPESQVIKAKYSNDELENMMDLQMSHPTRGQVALTEPDLEPDYPIVGRNVAPHLFLQHVKEHPSKVIQSESLPIPNNYDRTSLLLKSLVQEIATEYMQYCSHLELLTTFKNEKFTRRRFEANKVELTRLAGAEAVDRLHAELEQASNLKLPQ